MKKVLKFLEDLIEIYVPMFLFFLMFVIFLVGIVFRYILRSPLTWSNEAISICFLEMVLMASCYVQRRNDHVKFSMIMDLLPVKIQAVLECIGYIVVLIALIYLLPPAATYIMFLKGVNSTPVFGIGLEIVYFPFIIFILLNIVYAARNITRQIRLISGSQKQQTTMEEKG